MCEMQDSLHPFEKSVFLDYVFEEETTSLGDQVLNELTVNELYDFSIEFKENQVTLSSTTPFSLNRSIEKVIVNHAPRIDLECVSFLECTIRPVSMYRDEELPSKVYRNQYRDEVYMQSLVSDAYHNIPVTPLYTQIEIVTAHHQERVDDLVLDQLVEAGQIKEEMRVLMHMTLAHSCSGIIKPELMKLFDQLKETLIATHTDVFSQTLAQDIECVKKWGSLGEKDMHMRIDKDRALYTQANLLHAVKHTKWVLRGSQLSQLQFFNFHYNVMQVDFYNRSFTPRTISYGPQNVLGPYERVRVERRYSTQKNTKSEFISYTGGSTFMVVKSIHKNDAHTTFFKPRLTSGTATVHSYFEDDENRCDRRNK